MYRLRDMERGGRAAGLVLRDVSGTVGINHNLLRFERAAD